MKNLHKNIIFGIPLILFIPVLLNAASFSLAGSNFKGVIDEILSVIALAIPILFAGAFLIFFWGLSKFILNSGSQAEIVKGRNYMIWGTLALFILISVRAIISLISGDLGLGDSSAIPLIDTNVSPNTSVNWQVIP